MINVVKPFKVLDIKKELDGGQGVTFQAYKTEYLSETKTRTITMTNYISIPEGLDVDLYLFETLSKEGWV